MGQKFQFLIAFPTVSVCLVLCEIFFVETGCIMARFTKLSLIDMLRIGYTDTDRTTRQARTFFRYLLISGHIMNFSLGKDEKRSVQHKEMSVSQE